VVRFALVIVIVGATRAASAAPCEGLHGDAALVSAVGDLLVQRNVSCGDLRGEIRQDGSAIVVTREDAVPIERRVADLATAATVIESWSVSNVTDPLLVAHPIPVVADYRPQPMPKDIVIKVNRDRDTNNMLLIGGIAAAGALLGAVGVYYNLDSRDAAEAISPKMPTSQPWTSAQQADYDRAHSSGVKAGVFYGLGGAALLASAVLFIVTAPGEDRTVIHPHYAIAPTQGGAFVARAWSF